MASLIRPLKVRKAANALNAYADEKRRLEPQIQRLAKLKKAAVEAAKAAGQDIEVHGASAKQKSGYERVTWNGKLLDGYAMDHPEILPARKVSQVKPSVAIKVEVY